ncbi:hypothetical protein BJP75_00005090 [Bacteroides thetaiotaomicron]|nr:hypothetical protein [Bacteroides thetaiotaomicron]
MPTAKRIETSAFGGCSSLKKFYFLILYIS